MYTYLITIVCIVEFILILWLLNIKRNRQKQELENKIMFFRDLWGKLIFYIIATSIIGLFVGSVYFKRVIGLTEINSWVGIVLGLVALIIGIISLFLSFYNVDQSTKSQKQSIDIMNGVKNDIKSEILNMNEKMNDGFTKLHDDIRYKYIVNDDNKDVVSQDIGWEDDNE